MEKNWNFVQEKWKQKENEKSQQELTKNRNVINHQNKKQTKKDDKLI